MIFRCSALLLGLAFAGAPLAADYCAVSCEAAHMDGAAASTAHAGHHHGSTALFSISQPPQPCGHDHNGVVGIASSDGRAPVRSLAPGAAVTPALSIIQSVSFSIRDVHGSSPPPGTPLRGFVSPLRV
ncbi:MAG TPA: hypothetical protein VGJ39_06505 [Vicinamibacterales bacterium]